VRFSRLSFRVILVPVCALFLAVCASARSDASLPGAVMGSEGPAFDFQLKANAVKEQVEAILDLECPAAGRCRQPSDNHQPTNLAVGEQLHPSNRCAEFSFKP